MQLWAGRDRTAEGCEAAATEECTGEQGGRGGCGKLGTVRRKGVSIPLPSKQARLGWSQDEDLWSSPERQVCSKAGKKASRELAGNPN